MIRRRKDKKHEHHPDILFSSIEATREPSQTRGRGGNISLFVQLFFSNLMAIALCGILLPMLDISAPWYRLAIYASLTTALLLLFLYRRRQLLILLAVVVMLAVLALIFPDKIMTRWYSQFFISQIAKSRHFIAWLLTTAVSALCFILIDFRNAAIAMLLVAAALYGVFEFIFEPADSAAKIYFFLAILSSLYFMALGRHKKSNPYALRRLSRDTTGISSGEALRRNRAIILAFLLVIFVAFFDAVLPKQFFASPYLEKTMDDIILFGSGKTRPVSYYLEFSLAELGYQPLERRLGGTAVPDTGPFITVETDGYPLWLKGSARREYTATSWLSEGMDPRWRFNDEDAIEAQRIAIGVRHQSEDDFILTAARNMRLNVYPRRAQQVIFQVTRPSIIRPINSRPRFDIHFNRSGSLYLDDLVPEQGYTVLGQSILPLYLQTEESIDRFIAGYDTAVGKHLLLSKEERQSYLALPDMPHLEAEVFAFDDGLHRLIYRRNNAMTDAMVVANIHHALSSKIEYSLESGVPAEEEEFVGWFLKEKKGYCTHFATAVTVLAREAGIPARYVEGFLIPATAPGRPTRQTLTGEHAHAWAEVWIDELGWLPVDATPVARLSQMIRTDYMTGEMPNEPVIKPTEPVTPPTLPEVSELPEPPVELLPDHKPVSAWSQLPFLLKASIVLIPLWLYLLWRHIVYQRRYDEAYLLKVAGLRGHADLLQSIISDLFTMWALDGRVRRQHETLRRFIKRVERERYESFPSDFIAWYETLLYAAEQEQMSISQGEWRRLIDFHREEELYLRRSIGNSAWFFKRWLTAFQIKGIR